MKATGQMIDLARAKSPNIGRPYVAEMLDAALADFEFAPFELSKEAREAHAALTDNFETASVRKNAEVLMDECLRFLHTLTPKHPATFTATEAELRALDAVEKRGELSHGYTLAKAVRRAMGAAVAVVAEHCTCHIVGNLQMSTGCALHGEGEPDEEQPHGEWSDADRHEAVTGYGRELRAQGALASHESEDWISVLGVYAALDAVAYRLAPQTPICSPLPQTPQGRWDTIQEWLNHKDTNGNPAPWITQEVARELMQMPMVGTQEWWDATDRKDGKVAVTPLSEHEEIIVEHGEGEKIETLHQSYLDNLIEIIRKRFPKPAPAVTAQELADLARAGRGGEYDAALAELVRRAELGVLAADKAAKP